MSAAPPARASSKYWFCLAIILLVYLMSGMTASAYKPPKKPSSPSDSTSTTGTRGCDDSPIALTALAPHQHVGQTSSRYPTFTWFVPDQTERFTEFQLYVQTPQGTQQLVYQTELLSSPGFMHFALPITHAGLGVGQRYRWQVIMFCEPNSPSSAIVAAAEIEVVKQPLALVTALPKLPDALERAQRFADAGFWYDALAEIPQSPNRFAASALRITLLQQLADLEANAATNPAPAQAERFRQIVAAEQSSAD